MGYFVSGGGIAASRHAGLNETDVFSINEQGQVCFSWVEGGGEWQGPLTIGPAGIANAGACVVASQQFGLYQTDVFLIDTNGQLNVLWVDNQGRFCGPQKIGPAGIANPGASLAVSQQFGLNQTDVFLIDTNGQLNVFWVDNGGAWGGPKKIGPAGIAKSGAPLAASQQFGLNQTDVFLIDQNGQLNVFWVDNGGTWGGPEKIGPAGIAEAGSFLAASQQFGLNQTDVFVIDKNGQLNVFWVDNGGAWGGPEKIGAAGIANPGAPLAASQQFGLNQTDVFLIDTSGQLNVFWVDNGGAWGGPEKIGPAGIANPGSLLAASQQFGLNQTDVFLIDTSGQLNVFWVDNGGAWGGPLVRGNPVPAPSGGLGNNFNYYLGCNGNPVTDLQTSICVNEDIVFQSANGSNTGFSFQLNTSSPLANKCKWQQFVLSFFNNQILGVVNLNFGKDKNNNPYNPDYFCYPVVIGAWSGTKLSAGNKLTISLANDGAGNITSATFSVFDPEGEFTAYKTIELMSIQGVTTEDLAPIAIFQLDLVGPLDVEHVVLSSGDGIFGYSSSAEMTVLNAAPSWTRVNCTGEEANSLYGVMSSTPSKTFTQSFSVGPAS
jgi:hypothetical protein